MGSIGTALDRLLNQRRSGLRVGQPWKVERKCMDAGFVEFWQVIMVVTDSDALLMIDDLGSVFRMKRCEKVPE